MQKERGHSPFPNAIPDRGASKAGEKGECPLFPGGDGSLTEIKNLEAAGKLATAAGQQASNFDLALTRMKALYDEIKQQGQAWEDLLYIPNKKPAVIYQFGNPYEFK